MKEWSIPIEQNEFGFEKKNVSASNRMTINHLHFELISVETEIL